MIYPLKNIRITSPFGWRLHPVYKTKRFHYGVDFAGATGTEIYAIADGEVTLVSGAGAYGNHLMIKHGIYESFYAHCSKILVKEKDKVQMGQVIAYVGSTGLSTGPHLHFGIKLYGEYVNPIEILEENKMEEVKIKKEGQDFEGYRIKGKTFVELRAFAQSNGQEVSWDEESRTALVSPGAYAKLAQIKKIVEGV